MLIQVQPDKAFYHLCKPISRFLFSATRENAKRLHMSIYSLHIDISSVSPDAWPFEPLGRKPAVNRQHLTFEY